MGEDSGVEVVPKRDWMALTAAVGAQFAAWRQEHPRATWAELEGTLDARWQVVRARLVEEAVAASPLAHLPEMDPAERPRCPACHVKLQARGSKERSLRVEGDHRVRLFRSQGCCPQCGGSFFPSGRGVGIALGRAESDTAGEADPVGD
jgi:hypothetical protein